MRVMGNLLSYRDANSGGPLIYNTVVHFRTLIIAIAYIILNQQIKSILYIAPSFEIL